MMEYYVITLDFKDGGSRNFLVSAPGWGGACAVGEELFADLEAEDFSVTLAHEFIGYSIYELCTF